MADNKVLFFAVVAGCLAVPAAWAQSVSARLDGVVADSSKAVVTRTVVTAHNQDTAANTQAVTNDSGEYIFPNLVPGRYTVSTGAPGFKKVEVKDLVLQIGDAKRLDVTLVPGAVTESVEVVAEAPTVDTSTTRVGSVVDNRQAVDLPLNGRDPMMLFYLQAGTNPLDRLGSLQQTGVVDGLPPGTSEIKVEGILSINAGYDYAPSHPNTPVPQEAVGEYRVSTAGDLSDSGKGSGAQVRVLIKSGTNQFHGSLFEFNRNTDYNANDFFSNQTGLARAILVRNQFGGSFGGPIRRNKTFFFVTAEAQRQVQDSVENREVYTQSARNGIFRYYIGGQNSSSIVGQNGQPLIPASSIGTISLTTIDPSRQGFDTVFLPKILSVMPMPNNYSLGDGLNTAGYRYDSPNPDNYYQFLAKVDHNLNDSNRLALTLSQEFESAPQAKMYNGISPEGFTEFRQAASLRYLSTLSPTFMNELSIGANLRKAERPETNPAQQSPMGNFQLAGLGTGSVLTGGTNGNINSQRSNQVNPAVTVGFQDNATKIFSNHTISFGGEFWHQTLNRTIGADEYPLVTTSNSGNPATVPALAGLNTTDRSNAEQLVNDLTGTVGQVSQTFYLSSKTGFTPYQQDYQEMRKNEAGFFVQDLWKVRPNLTLNVGLRYELLPPVTILNVYAYPIGGLAGALGVQGPTGQPTQWGYAGNGGSVFNTDYKDFAPSFGFAWDPFGNGKTSIRGSYHFAYDRTQMVSGDFSSTNYGTSTVVTLTPAIRFTQLSSVLPIATPSVFPPLGNIRQGSAYVAEPGLKPPKVQQWSFGIQREIFRDWTVSASYVGNHAVGIWDGEDLNQINITTNGFLPAFQIAQQNLAASGNPTTGQSVGALLPLFKLVPSSEYNVITQGQVASLANYLDTTTLTTGQRGGLVGLAGLPPTFFRYNPQVQDLYTVGNWGQSTWDGFQLEVRRRLAKGVTLQANYTLSKGFTNVGSSDAQTFTSAFRSNSNLSLDKSLSPLDSTHVILINGVWELPIGHGKALLPNASRWLEGILGGWQLNGIYNFTTGRPVSITSGRQDYNQLVSSTANFSGGFTNLNTVYKGGNQVTFITPAGAAAFSNPAAGSPGGLPTYELHGPGFTNLDASLFRYFSLNRLREGMALQVRAEFFNVFNHTNFSIPGSENINSGSFGVLTSDFSPRVGQFALKLKF